MGFLSFGIVWFLHMFHCILHLYICILHLHCILHEAILFNIVLETSLSDPHRIFIHSATYPPSLKSNNQIEGEIFDW